MRVLPADFSNALLVDPSYPTYTDPTGVIYWQVHFSSLHYLCMTCSLTHSSSQAPEMRNGPYDARKVDVWSAGTTASEMAEAEPPFMNMDISDPSSFLTTLTAPISRRHRRVYEKYSRTTVASNDWSACLRTSVIRPRRLRIHR